MKKRLFYPIGPLTKPLLYLSGPMTGYKNKNFAAFHRATRKLRLAGYPVVNPAELDAAFSRPTWEESLKRDIQYQMRCDAVAVLPGCKKSRGAQLEIYIARKLAWPVHTVNYYLRRK